MAKGWIDRLIDEIFDAEWTGRYGEALTVRELNLVKLFGRNGKILRNIYVPKDNGETTEIDVIFITQKGIFVIESKNYSGWIFGDEKSLYWTACLPNRDKNRFYNPIMQNQTHIKWLKQYLNENIPLFSIVAFSERCELKKVTVNNPEIHVIKREYLYATIRDIWNKMEDKLDKEKQDEIYKKIKQLTQVDEAVKLAHVKNIQEKYTASQKEKSADDVNKNELICPQCGAKLVLRTAKKGMNAGSQFYGCGNFPKCRYVQNIKDIKE